MTKYYTLLLRDDSKSYWFVNFGSYDRDEVIAERDDYCYSTDEPKSNTKIITTDEDQEAIDSCVTHLNSLIELQDSCSA